MAQSLLGIITVKSFPRIDGKAPSLPPALSLRRKIVLVKLQSELFSNSCVLLPLTLREKARWHILKKGMTQSWIKSQ